MAKLTPQKLAEIKKKAGNSISEYLLIKREERRPGDNNHAQAVRTGIRNDILGRMYKAPGAWKQAVYLMRVCADLGIDPISALTQTETKYDKDKDVSYWKDLYFETKKEVERLKENNKKLIESVNKFKAD